MRTLEEQIDVDVPLRTAWEQLHRIDQYPRFVDGVLSASALGRNRAHLELEVAGTHHELDAEIVDRGQGKVMGWETLDGPRLKGTFALRPLDADHTQLQIRLEYDPDTLKSQLGGPKGFAQVSAIERTVREDLEHFKQLVEER
ncbi:SRPBCC family protein [Kitasatospora camelliae]|uniref:SRPBCC family protein n=1 Tax=Kitasatospora camelliae TaxID=3156397 RepID=A0AAU8K5X0_9ACTN